MTYESNSLSQASKCAYGTCIKDHFVQSSKDRLAYLLEDQRRMAKAKNYFAWQGRLVLPEIGRRVIEVGCGTGNFTGMLLDREAVIALDVQPACIERLLERYPGQSNLEAYAFDANSPDFTALARFRPDSCVCLNVLEHVEDDHATVRAMASILVSGGTVALLLPALPALTGPIDRNLGHFRRYRAADVHVLAETAGLRIRKMHFVNAIGMFGWWADARLLRLGAIPQWQIAAFDKLVAPVLSRVEAIAPPPFGQSLFAVLEKP